MKSAVDLLQEIQGLDPKLEPEIIARVRYWLEGNFDDKTKQEIAHLIESDREALVDAFYTTLSFGTGGMRGLMGVGANRMNIYTVSWATQGLANYLKKVYPAGTELKVAIGYDSRHNSKQFAESAASCLAGNGIHVYIYSEIRPTPLVSFACRYHKCHAAVMVTASHNPPQYNGYKVYWDDGAQVLPPHDTGIMEEVGKLRDPDQVKKAPLTSPLIHYMKSEEDNAYLEAIKPLQLWPETGKKHGNSLKILYSSLHGTGITMVPRALMEFGYASIGFVNEQIIPDGDFPTCPKPNPEERAALELGIQKLLREGYDLFIATDPDCDRMGVVVLHKGQAIVLTGNQELCLAVEFVIQALKESKRLPDKAAFVKTVVTSDLFRHIVEGHEKSCFDVLTGFKYIAEKIRTWESTENGYKYIYGGEESYGSLLGTVVRDKDAVIFTCLMSEIALLAKRQGKTLIDLLDEIYLRYGVFSEHTLSLEFEETKEGKEKMKAVMQHLRQKCPEKVLQYRVVKSVDLSKPHPELDLPLADVMILTLDDGSSLVVRPSGTEPRTKIYVLGKESTKGATQAQLPVLKAKVEAKVVALGNELKKLLTS